MALFAMALAVFVVANDFTALSVALPQMEGDLGADVGTIQWVINAYALVFGVFIITGGRLADLFGRRRMFFVGAGIFGFFSLLAGAAPSAELLIAARALMAIGGAMMWPAVVGLAFAILPPSKAGLAGGLILGVSGIGNAFGPLLGGFLTDELSWRWVLFLNVPIALLAVTVTYLKVRGDRPEHRDERIDYAGTALLSIALVALLVALDQVTDWGWTSPATIGLLAVFVAGLALLRPVERRAGRNALLARDVLSNRQFTAACFATFFMSMTFFALLVYAPQYMVKVLDFSALEAGLGFLPLMGVFGATSFAAGPLYNRVGGRLLLIVGAACIPVGTLLVTFAPVDGTYADLVPGLAIAGVGVGLFYSALTTAAITVLDQARSSLGGGILYMFQVVGGSIGLGLTTTVFTSVADDHVSASAIAGRLSAEEERAVGQVLSGTDTAQQLLARLPDAAAELERIAREAFVAGVHAGLRVDVALALVALGIVVVFMHPARPDR